jgi:hypothetical protein
MAIFTNEGLTDLTELMLQIETQALFILHLYTNNYTPACASTLGNFTECQLGGYDPIDLVPAQWTGDVASCVAQYTYPTQTWTFDAYSAAQNTVIYGWYVTNNATNHVIMAEQFATPYTVPFEGGQILLTLNWNDQNC